MNSQSPPAQDMPSAPPSTRDPADAAALFAAAFRHHHAGRLREAERLYLQVLATNPQHADSLHSLGLIALQVGRADVAAELISRAIAAKPDIAAYHINLGNCLQALSRLEEAIASQHRALALEPQNPLTHSNLGVALKEAGRLDEAVLHFLHALALGGDHPGRANNLGAALQDLGQLEEAADWYRKALAIRPDFPQAHNNLGNVLIYLDRLEEASVHCRRAIELQPDFGEAHHNLGLLLKELQQIEEAICSHRRALELKPDYPEAWNSLGMALYASSQLAEAMDCFRRAIALKPDYSSAHNNLGVLLYESRAFEEAISSFNQVLALHSDHAEAHHHLGLVLLTQGRFQTAWPEYEWRWKTQALRDADCAFRQPRWRGEAAMGQTLLIHAEQGYGDTLQFCRYASVAAARGLRVILHVPQPLVRVLRSLDGVAVVLSDEDALPAFDLQCPMLSLPLAFDTTLENIPGVAPYLRADAAGVAAWQERLSAMGATGLRVGLVWAGNPRLHVPAAAAIDRRRSLQTSLLTPILAVPNVHFISLQKDGPPAPEGAALFDAMAAMNDFADTAALIEALDLVISVDTAVAHLAAALGKPVWLLDRFDHCWRWLQGRTDSPWYPGLRIYRQPRAGDWGSVVDAVARDLRIHAKA